MDDRLAQALRLNASGRGVVARARLGEVREADPAHPGALLCLASLALDERDAARAEGYARSVVAGSPDLAHAWTTLALALSAQRRYDEALEAAKHGCELAPHAVAIRRAWATIALERGDAATAIAACRDGLQMHPEDIGLKCTLADALSASGAYGEASECLAPIVDSPRANAESWLSFGALCVALDRCEEAIRYLRKAIEGGQDVARAWDNLGTAYRRMKRPDDAVAAFERAVDLDPRLSPALSNLCMALRDACRWDDAQRRERIWLASLDDPRADPRRPPFVALALTTTPRQQREIARSWSTHALPRVAAPAIIATRGTRLRVGYLTGDFRTHPIAHLTAGLFECHDRARIEATAYSYGADDGSAIRQRIRSAFEHWTDVRAMSDDACARQIRADAIDVLVEMVGHTQGGRLGIVARRPAPVQIHYLGFPGTLGFDAIDAIVADRVLVPEGDERWYHERVLRLPRCYQVNDDRRGLLPPVPRASLGLAEDAIVLASFNQAYKLTPVIFDVWCQTLREHPRTVLWLYQPDRAIQSRLLAEGARLGVAPERIVFAAQAEQDVHLARLQAADLMLDVLPYGSHTTGSDALWAGVPMLSCRGETFAGRVGASLLDAAGLSELVTESISAYRADLSRLAGDRERLAAYKAYLVAERANLRLFDTQGFARDFEALLEGAANALR